MINFPRKGIYVFLVLLSSYLSSFCQQRAFDPGLFSIGFDVKPYTQIGQQGTYTFSFGNLGSCIMPVSRGALVMTIRMSQDTVVPNVGVPLADLSGPFVSYFSWTFNASSNSYIGTQISDIPDVGYEGGGISSGLGAFNVSIRYVVPTPSTANFGQGGNGIFVSLSVPSYVLGTTSPNPPGSPPNCPGTQVGGNANNDAIRAFNYFGGNLPIRLSEFNVKKTNNRSAFINWSTYSEINTLEFQLERKTDKSLEWEIIHIRAAAGNSSIKKEYNYTDNLPNTGSKIYYRIKTIDVDGSYNYTDIESINVEKSDVKSKGYPNPVKDLYHLTITGSKDDKVSIDVFDILGRSISRQSLSIFKGANYHDLNLGSYSPGTYIVRVSSGDINESMTVVKVE